MYLCSKFGVYGNINDSYFEHIGRICWKNVCFEKSKRMLHKRKRLSATRLVQRAWRDSHATSSPHTHSVLVVAPLGQNFYCFSMKFELCSKLLSYSWCIRIFTKTDTLHFARQNKMFKLELHIFPFF